MTENVQLSWVHIYYGAHDQLFIFPVYVPRFELPGRIISGEPGVPA